jgi:DeoR family suf operon transcriptional repressor
MLSAHRPITGFRGLPRKLLVALKKAQPITVKQLADEFKITGNALRRHLKSLEASGLVRYRREARGVGGPRFAYSLTEMGEGLFPRAYAGPLAEALDIVRAERGIEGVVGVFTRHWAALTDPVRDRMASLPLAQRAELLAELRTSQGYMAEAVAAGPGETVIREHNCAIREVAERFPEVCTAEALFFSELLGAPVHREAHILSGCNACEYRVQVPTLARRTERWPSTAVEDQA